MPRKIRQLEADLKRAGFALERARGKGSHRSWVHPTGVRVTVSGQAGADAHDYQEKDVREAIQEAARRERERRP